MTAKRRVTTLLCAAFTIISWPFSANAWNATGHRMVASIAWETMTPATRETASRLLQNHPDYERWRKKAPNEDTERQVFIATATWPDEIRKDKRFFTPGKEDPTPLLPGFPDMFRHNDWHYLARPLDEIAASDPGLPTHRGQIDRQLVAQAHLLGNAKATPVERQYALPWIIHLVGDVHQPLHTSLRQDASGNWDKLGNGLMITNPFNPRKPSTTLHSFWDDLPGASGLRGAALDSATHELMARHPQVVPQLTSAEWLEESWHIACRSGYPQVLGETGEISAAFLEQSREIAGRRVVEAGRRLGQWLNALLGQQ